AGFVVQAARISLSIERNLRRSERLLGLRSAGRGAETQRPRSLVAGHGPRPRRYRYTSRRARTLRNDGPRLHDHHAPAGLEVLGAFRPLPRLHGRLPRVEEALPPRPGER